jgi:folate-binding protein YgfZ
MTALKNIGVKKRSAALRVKGPDSFRFLNGMLTQDIQKTSEHLPSGARSFFLTNKGKIIAPLYFISLNQEEVFIWAEESAFDALKSGLERYLIADKVRLEAAGSFDSWTLLESEFNCETIKNRHPLGLEKIFKAHITQDFYVLPQARLSSSHVEVLSLDASFQASEMSKESFWKKHFDTGTPHWGIDLFAEDFFLEFPLSDAVSFDKGCYVGQETVARGTFRGKVNKSFAKITSDKKLNTGEITNEAGEKIGTIRNYFDNLGTGIIKFDLPKDPVFLINGEKHVLQIEHMVNEETFRKGR